MVTPTTIAAYLVLFAAVACAFVAVNLAVGRLLRPNQPSPEKKEIYECGEPVIGSSFVRFDIRFYVVALLFIIFDVEVAFFFPWAVVFGKASQIVAAADTAAASPAMAEASAQVIAARLSELTATPLAVSAAELPGIGKAASGLVWGGVLDIVLFFMVLMVGFAYVWSRGDLDWVRTTINQPLRNDSPDVPNKAEAA
ncbi:NADH-quinone oxidoreductase subunit A [Botrimarina hoheduenensis]|uniref:NADH-quinone oxidoreductase subunit A n=1 Tax=Botrimarina hoheduenensis TaxID=2528000 RepID=A0A5C5WEM6_9BACT|nr:NADH-quinone oxidoreductase subunit A [Botrimarina hoheduenensis]TWT48529.1 NAD(P)H-quinone oxidoreductase subunit 3 [Botrimarina hoheduenensis]